MQAILESEGMSVFDPKPWTIAHLELIAALFNEYLALSRLQGA